MNHHKMSFNLKKDRKIDICLTNLHDTLVTYESQESSSTLAFRKTMSPVAESLLCKYV